MKKLLLLMPIIFLLAAGCSFSQQASIKNAASCLRSKSAPDVCLDESKLTCAQKCLIKGEWATGTYAINNKIIGGHCNYGECGGGSNVNYYSMGAASDCGQHTIALDGRQVYDATCCCDTKDTSPASQSTPKSAPQQPAASDLNTESTLTPILTHVEKSINPSLCISPGTPTAIGGEVFPTDQKYKNIEYLGRLFTAFNCGPKRVNEIYGLKGEYAEGSVIRLKGNPSQALITIFKSIGFVCKDRVAIENCKNWELGKTVKINDLIRLAPYYESFESDDCVHCG